MGCLPNPSRTAFPTADDCGADPRVSMVSIKTQYTLICDTIDTHRHPLEMVHFHAPDHLLAERDTPISSATSSTLSSLLSVIASPILLCR